MILEKFCLFQFLNVLKCPQDRVLDHIRHILLVPEISVCDSLKRHLILFYQFDKSFRITVLRSFHQYFHLFPPLEGPAGGSVISLHLLDKIRGNFDAEKLFYFILKAESLDSPLPIHHFTKHNRRPRTHCRSQNPRSYDRRRIHTPVLAPVCNDIHRNQLKR